MVKQVRSAIWYSDPGHAWLAVAGSLIRDLKIQDRISRYSYKGQDSTVYLEEDCDAPELIAAANAAGIQLVITECRSHGDSFIRKLAHY